MSARVSPRPLTLRALLRGAVDDAALEFRGCGPDTEVTGLCVDSREVTPGVAFLAIHGATHDAHRFIPAAVAAGARVVIAAHNRVATLDDPGPALALVPDTNAAYARLAANAFAHPQARLRLVGITGTNGKTTTSHLVSTILETAGRPHTRIGTTDNWVVDRREPAGFTTPFPLELQGLLARTLARGGGDVVMEVSSHALAQRRVETLEFAAVGLTSFSQDHLDFHATMDDYLAAKCALARDYLRSSGVAVAAGDDPAAARFLDAAARAGAERWRVCSDPDAGSHAELRVVRWLDPGPDAGDPDDAPAVASAAAIVTPHGAATLRTPLIGAFNIDNALVALGLCLGVGVSLPQALAGLRRARGAPGRLERVAVTGVRGPTVLVDYAHTPDAVARALGAVRPSCRGQLWVVLGCGGDRDPTKRPLMGALAAAHADRFIATSDNPRTEDPDAIVDQMIAGVAPEHRARLTRAVDRGAAIALAVAAAEDDDVVLIAGKGHEDYQIIGTQTRHFDDREQAAAARARRR